MTMTAIKFLKEYLKERKKKEAEASKAPWLAFENGPWGNQGYGVLTSDNVDEEGGHDIRAFITDRDDNSEESATDAKFIEFFRNSAQSENYALEQLLKIYEIAYKSSSNSEKSKIDTVIEEAAKALGWNDER